MTQIGNFIAVTDAKIVRIFLDIIGSMTDRKMTTDRSKKPLSGFAGLVKPISCLVERGDRMYFVRVAVLRQHAEDARYFVAATITPKGSASRDNKVGVTTSNPKMGKAVIICRMTALLTLGW
jgi:hypothetical protein